ncbi:MAG: beta-galactosidase [Oscillospiraceae bacterium]|nr:beta-galactosidase [Oscillospiraceae bacterium]
MVLKFPHFIHGGDYNPEQWLDRPDILARDIELMKEAHVNSVSVGIFAWSHLEPEEGVFQLDWLEEIIDRLYANGIYTVLATPSGARPLWMAHRYPEVLRMSRNLTRNRPGVRHNHCYTSPLYREKVRLIDTALAERFGHHPGVLVWHLSNELGGQCFCPLCQEAFRGWLKDRYGSLDALNKAWWTDFWSHRYSDWSEIEAPVPSGETSCHGLNLDWNRFVTHQTVDFARWERDTVKAAAPDLPVTTNHGESYESINYFKYKDVVDIVSWDSYPLWGRDPDEREIGQNTAFAHDVIRSIKRQPFMLMESAPSATNWQEVSRLRQPGIHMLASMQAVAHGACSVQYFQWRKSRGASEKFHGAVVDHYGGSDTRVFQEVKAVGERLEKLDALLDGCPRPKAAILYDWENGWAMNDAAGPRNLGMHYLETVMAHHKAFWKLGVSTDVIDMECGLDGYRLVVAPMAYLLRAGIADKLRRFCEDGGIVLGTYWTGIVDETDLCFLGGTPGDGLGQLFGLRSEEIDGLYDGQYNLLRPLDGFLPREEYRLTELCELCKCSTAQPLALYGRDFYEGMPALTRNAFGKGTAYYLAARGEQALLDDLTALLCREAGIEPDLDADLPDGVSAIRREGSVTAVFLQNYLPEEVTVSLRRPYRDFESGEEVGSQLTLKPFEVRILEER